MNKLIIFLERMWLMVAIICLALAVYKTIRNGYTDGFYFLMFACLATVLFLLRRRMRKRMEREHDQTVERN